MTFDGQADRHGGLGLEDAVEHPQQAEADPQHLAPGRLGGLGRTARGRPRSGGPPFADGHPGDGEHAKISRAAIPWCSRAARNAATTIGSLMFRPLFMPGMATAVLHDCRTRGNSRRSPHAHRIDYWPLTGTRRAEHEQHVMPSPPLRPFPLSELRTVVLGGSGRARCRHRSLDRDPPGVPEDQGQRHVCPATQVADAGQRDVRAERGERDDAVGGNGDRPGGQGHPARGRAGAAGELVGGAGQVADGEVRVRGCGRRPGW